MFKNLLYSLKSSRMKKLLALLLMLLSGAAFADQIDYKINDQAVDALFAQAQDIPLGSKDFSSIIPSASDAEKDKVIAGVMGILCGEFGIHRFYLGHTKAGLVYLGWTLCSGAAVTVFAFATWGFGYFLFPLVYVSGVMGVIDGILYLMSEDAEFQSKYAKNKRLIQWVD